MSVLFKSPLFATPHLDTPLFGGVGEEAPTPPPSSPPAASGHASKATLAALRARARAERERQEEEEAALFFNL